MGNALFRTEALAYRKQRLEGDILLTRSASLWLMTFLLSTITLVLILWALLGKYTRTETVSGSLVPNGVLAKVYADKPGRLIWLGVKDGDFVRPGQPLATIRTEQDLEGGTSPDKERLASVGEQSYLTLHQIRLETGRTDNEQIRLSRLIHDLSEERRQLSAEVDLQTQSVASTRSNFEAMTSLVDKGFETKTSYEQRRQAWLSASTELQMLVGQIAQLDERRSQAQSDLTKLPSDHASKVAELRNSLAQLQQKRIEIEGARAFTITAPVGGRVTTVQALAGRSIESRMPILVIVPVNAVMQAELYVPSRAIGMTKVGQEVRLMYDAFPYQRFGTFTGHITQISRSVLTPDEVDAPVKLQDPVYVMRVGLDQQKIQAFGEALPLQPGMSLNADVILDRRSFLSWFMEPLLAVRSRA